MWGEKREVNRKREEIEVNRKRKRKRKLCISGFPPPLEKVTYLNTRELLKGWRICPKFEFVKDFGFGSVGEIS